MGVRVPPSANQTCKSHQFRKLRGVPNLELGPHALYRTEERKPYNIECGTKSCRGVDFRRRVRQPPNERLERLTHATTNKGYSPASPPQARVGFRVKSFGRLALTKTQDLGT